MSDLLHAATRVLVTLEQDYANAGRCPMCGVSTERECRPTCELDALRRAVGREAFVADTLRALAAGRGMVLVQK
jgi:hypothetical protein